MADPIQVQVRLEPPVQVVVQPQRTPVIQAVQSRQAEIAVTLAERGAKGEQGIQGPQGPAGPNYTLPVANATTLGGVKQGANVTIDANGVLGTVIPATDWASITGKPTFASVATTGSYNSLADRPNLSVYLTSVDAASTYLTQVNAASTYLTPATANSLYVKPANLANVATTGNYTDLLNKPSLFSGRYTDLTDVPATFTPPVANATVLGGVKQGANLTIDANGVISACIPASDWASIANKPSLVNTFNSRSGNVTLALSDVTAVANWTYVPIVSNGTANTTFDSAGSTVTLSGSNIAYNGFKTFDGTRQSIMGLSGSTTSAATVPTMRQDANISGFTQTACVSFSALTSVVLSSLRKSCGTESVISGGCITLGTTSGVTIVGLSDSAANQTSLAINSTGLKVTSTGTATTWTSASVLTQGYADTRYQALGNYLTQANLTYSNISGTPTLAAVATSGNYADLANTPNLTPYLTSANAATTYVPKACGTSYFAVYDGDIIIGTTKATAEFQDNYIQVQKTLVGDVSHPPLGGSSGINIGENWLGNSTRPYVSLMGSIDYYFWADDSILCRKYADSRYLLTSNYTPYTLPAATNTTLGGIIVGSNLTIANGVLSAVASGGLDSNSTIDGGTF